MRALRSAATRLQMARRVLRGGREHADMGGAGVLSCSGTWSELGDKVRSLLATVPLLLGTREVQSEVTQLLEVPTR